MKTVNILEDLVFEEGSHRKTVLSDGDEYTLIRVTFTRGCSVPPCVVPSETIFYVVEGEGRVLVDGESTHVRTGALAEVPAGAERSIACDSERMVVLAVQVHST